MEVLLVLIFSATASAGHWTQLSEKKVTIRSESGIRKAFERYASLIKNPDRSDVVQVELTIFREQYTGVSLCPTGDARLFNEYANVRVERNDIMKSGLGLAPFHYEDPCAADSPDGRWVLDGESRIEYRTPEEINGFIARHRDLYPNITADDLEYITENPQHFHWEGKTVCAPGDRQLELTEDAGKSYFKIDNDVLPSVILHESLLDPCRS